MRRPAGPPTRRPTDPLADRVVLLGLKRTFDRSVGLPAVTLFLAPQLGSRSGLSL